MTDWPDAIRPLAALLVLSASIAGCTSGASVFHVDATDPMVMAPPSAAGFGYDGSGMVAATGSMTIHVADADNTGYVLVDLSVPSGPNKGHYLVNWTDFHIQSGSPWQDGGIACGPGLVEHGASGHGNKMEPQFDLACGGWGATTATRDGKALTDPIFGITSFYAHFMITKQAMLQPGGKVLKADQKTPFDPHDPGDGFVDPSRMEAHFAMWGQGAYQDGIAVPAAPQTGEIIKGSSGGLGNTADYDVRIMAGSTNLSLDARMTGGIGTFNVTLKDPTGKLVDAKQLMPLSPVRLSSPGPLLAGDYKVHLTGGGPNAQYAIDETLTPPTPFLLHVVFQDVTIA